MNNDLPAYKAFIDGLIGHKGSVFYLLNAFASREWNNHDAQKLNHLPDDIRNSIRAVMASAAEAAVHDVLAYVTDQNVQLEVDGKRLPRTPFGMTLYQDWALRVQGLDWYDEGN